MRDPFDMTGMCTMFTMNINPDTFIPSGLPFCAIPDFTKPNTVAREPEVISPDIAMPDICRCISFNIDGKVEVGDVANISLAVTKSDDCCEQVIDVDMGIDIPCLPISMAAVGTGRIDNAIVDPDINIAISRLDGTCAYKLSFDIGVPCLPLDMNMAATATVGGKPAVIRTDVVRPEGECVWNISMDLSLPPPDAFACETMQLLPTGAVNRGATGEPGGFLLSIMYTPDCNWQFYYSMQFPGPDDISLIVQNAVAPAVSSEMSSAISAFPGISCGDLEGGSYIEVIDCAIDHICSGFADGINIELDILKSVRMSGPENRQLVLDAEIKLVDLLCGHVGVPGTSSNIMSVSLPFFTCDDIVLGGGARGADVLYHPMGDPCAIAHAGAIGGGPCGILAECFQGGVPPVSPVEFIQRIDKISMNDRHLIVELNTELRNFYQGHMGENDSNSISSFYDIVIPGVSVDYQLCSEISAECAFGVACDSFWRDCWDGYWGSYMHAAGDWLTAYDGAPGNSGLVIEHVSKLGGAGDVYAGPFVKGIDKVVNGGLTGLSVQFADVKVQLDNNHVLDVGISLGGHTFITL